MRNFHLYIFLAFVTTLIMSSCFQNTDFDQGDDFVLEPVVELDLIYFDINASQFYDEATNTPNLTVRDTTEIEILEGSDIRDILQRADFLFKFTNSIPREFSINFNFLNAGNVSKYETSTVVNAGTNSSPVQTLFIDSLDEDEIESLTRSSKVVVTVTIPSANNSLTGNLNLQSKTTYFLEID